MTIGQEHTQATTGDSWEPLDPFAALACVGQHTGDGAHPFAVYTAFWMDASVTHEMACPGSAKSLAEEYGINVEDFRRCARYLTHIGMLIYGPTCASGRGYAIAPRSEWKPDSYDRFVEMERTKRLESKRRRGMTVAA